jgi:hypothetical protein
MASPSTVEIRVVASGADQAARVLQSVAQAGADVGRVTMSGSAQAASGLRAVSTEAGRAGPIMAALQTTVRGTGDAMGLAGVSTGAFGQALGMLTSPAGAVAAALGALGAAALAGVRAMSANADEVKRLMAVSGLSAGAADNLADTFQLLGKDSATLTNALFKMGAEVDAGGKALTNLGINVRDSGGALKSEGDLFLEVRDRISEMGSAGERSAALTALFGRAGRELADVMALSREEFRRVSEEAGGYSEWNETLQRQSVEYQRTLAALSLQFDALAQMIGRAVIPPLTDFLKSISETIALSKNPIDFTIRFIFPGGLGAGIVAALASVDQAVSRWMADMFKGTAIGDRYTKKLATPFEGLNDLLKSTTKSLDEFGRKPPVKPLSDEELANLKKAEESLDAFRAQLVALSVADPVARQLQSVREKVEELTKATPALAPQFAAIGAAMEAVIVHGANAATTLKELEASWKETTDTMAPAAERATLAIGAFEARLATTGDLGQAYRRTLGDVTFGLSETGQGLADITDVQNQAKGSGQELIAVWDDLGSATTETGQAALEFWRQMQQASVSAQALGEDFNLSGARIAALQTQFRALVDASQGELTPELQRVGAELRVALADQSLYASIESGFLSITDTFTKMADGLIQGTLDIGDAFADLGRNLLVNFVQIVLHEVFDPILKGAARFVSDLVGMLMGRQTTGAVAGLVGSIAGAFGGAGAAGAGGGWVESSTGLLTLAGEAGGAGAGGGGGTLGVLGSVGSGLASAYSFVAEMAGLKSLTALAAEGVKTLGASLGLLTPAATSAATATGALAGEAGFLAAEIGATGTGASVGAGTGAALGSAVGAGVILAPYLGAFALALGSMFATQERRFINRQRFIQSEGFTNETVAGLAGLEAGQRSLGEASIQTQISVLGQAAREVERRMSDITSYFAEFGENTEAVLAAQQDGHANAAYLRDFIAQMERLGLRINDTEEHFMVIVDSTEEFQDIIRRYTAVLASAKSAAEVAAAAEQERIDEIERFNREVRPGLIEELMGDLPKIALLLDLPSLAREGEDTSETLQRMVVALSGLEDQMENLAARARAMRGDLRVTDQLADGIGRITESMDALNIVLQTTGDPEKIREAAAEMEALIDQRLELELAALDTLTTALRAQVSSLSSGLGALARAAPVLRRLGVDAGDITGRLAGLVDFLGGVGDIGSSLIAMGGLLDAVASSMQGADAATILALSDQLAGALGSVLEDAATIGEPVQQMEALQAVLGGVVTGYESGVTALRAYYDAERQEATDAHETRVAALGLELDAIEDQRRAADALHRERISALNLELDAVNDQAAAVSALLADARAWRVSAEGLRDIILGLQTGPESPLNPAEQLGLVQERFRTVLDQFWAQPSADLARTVGDVGTGLIAQLGEVYSQPSPAYQAIFDAALADMAAVAAAAEQFAAPEAGLEATLAGLESRSEAIRAEVERLNTEHAVVLAGLDARSDAVRAAVDALNRDHAATLQAIDRKEQSSLDVLIGGFTAVWNRLGLLDSLGYIWGETHATAEELRALVGGRTIDQSIADRTRETAERLETLHSSIHESLRSLVGDRIDALLQQGGPQAIANALQGPLSSIAVNTSNTVANLAQIAHLIAYPGGTGPIGHLKYAQSGEWEVPGQRPYMLHRGEMVLPAPVASWFREHGPVATAGSGGAGPTITFAPGSIVVQGTGDADATARSVVREFERLMQDRGWMPAGPQSRR